MWYTVESDLNEKSQSQSTMISYGSYIIDNEDEPNRTERGSRDQLQCSGKDGESEFISVESLYEIRAVPECDVGDIMEFRHGDNS